MKLGYVAAGAIARFQAVAVQQVRGLEIAGLLKRDGSQALAQYCRRQRIGDARSYESTGGRTC